MVRNVIGSILALVGAAAAVWSPFRAWYDGRHGRDYRIADLFSGISESKADLWISILLPFAFAALVTLVGLLLRSRLLVVLAGLIVLGFTILWMIRQGQAAGSLSVESDGSGLGPGVALAAGGGVLLLLAAVLMSGRRRAYEPYEPDEPHRHTWGRGHGRRRRGRGEPDRHEEEPYGQQPHTDDTRTAEYPRYDDRPGDGYGPGEPGPPHRG
ncbi:hypothetical protein AMK26_26535 [Streptomyces sp. CB03234]|uniref:hypothetical protein n=1 Tax=Streptomyces sp. (strain CB03234) TaxID=1703937 RepID=UPI00093A41B0|nr:hypothetical protein [Streptomyces sp. CB03234]OKJ99584.1 hypothetical protein AMK26_26535 [Streptomyces sp. CB03234]